MFSIFVIIIGHGLAQSDTADIQQRERIAALERENRELRESIATLTRRTDEIQTLTDSLSGELRDRTASQKASLDNISGEMSALSDSIGTKIACTEEKANGVEARMRGRTLEGIAIAILISAAILFCYLLLRRRISRHSTLIENIEQTQQRLQEAETAINNKLVELLEGKLKIRDLQQNLQDPPFALKVADEIVRIENNIWRMDEAARLSPNIKRLSQAVQRLKNSFASNGYEIVDLMGSDYKEGMQVKATFITDETLPVGRQVITGVNKLQVNYNGMMIQAADVTVSQNI